MSINTILYLIKESRLDVPCWSSFVPVAVIKILIKQIRELRVHLAYNAMSLSITEGSQGRSSRYKLEGRPLYYST